MFSEDRAGKVQVRQKGVSEGICHCRGSGPETEKNIKGKGMGFGVVRRFEWNDFGEFEHVERSSGRLRSQAEPTDRFDQQGRVLPGADSQQGRWIVSCGYPPWTSEGAEKESRRGTRKEPSSRAVDRIEPRYMTKSGVRVRSKAEKIIADYFSDHRIWFIYEMPLRLGGLCLRPDFYLPDYDIIHEHFGLEEECYRLAAEAKISQYQRHGIGFSYTTAADEADIEEVLTRKLRRYGVRV